jgi:hypothetical protein
LDDCGGSFAQLLELHRTQRLNDQLLHQLRVTRSCATDLLFAGDDQDSKELFRSVVDGFGFAPVDLGPLRMGRLMQVDGPLTGLHAIRESVPHPMPKTSNNAVSPVELSAGTWTIDPVHSSISFSVRHLMVSRVRGTLGTFSGEITVSSEGTPSVSAEVTVGSVSTGNDQRDAHLKSAEFLRRRAVPDCHLHLNWRAGRRPRLCPRR